MDAIGDPVTNRDGMFMLQILNKPTRKSDGNDTLRGGWVPVAPKKVSVNDKKKRYLRKIGDE